MLRSHVILCCAASAVVASLVTATVCLSTQSSHIDLAEKYSETEYLHLSAVDVARMFAPDRLSIPESRAVLSMDPKDYVLVRLDDGASWEVRSEATSRRFPFAVELMWNRNKGEWVPVGVRRIP